MRLHNYTIMPLDTDHLEEICQDIREQYENGTATCALFKMTLVPEGNPPVDKVGILCAKYDLFRDRLAEMGLGSGVLVQASIGHGWVLSQMYPYQSYTGINSGEEVRVVCPYDEGFRAYIKNAFAVIAAHKPDTVMLDDDFRLMSFRSFGCGCPLHVARFNELWGDGAFSRQEIWEMLHRRDETGDRANELFIETQREAMIDCARLMREGIDSVDPTLPGTFCCVGNNVECAAEIAEILAGEGNPRVVRLNNGHYTQPANHNFSNVFRNAAESIAKLQGTVDVILAETDTCPQNRYSTSAVSLHTHFTGTLLEGARGAKHWITRLSTWEPESGTAYRRILGKYRGFYEAIADLVPRLHHRGCCIPVTSVPEFDQRKVSGGSGGWSGCVLERLGLPVFFSSVPQGIVCLDGAADAIYTDAQMEQVLSGAVFLASDTAKRLIDRGFGDDLGVDVTDWTGEQPSYEVLPYRGNGVPVQQKYRALIPRAESVVEHSIVYHSVDRVNPKYLFPGVTAYQNDRGGQVFVFCGTPNVPYGLTTSFSFLNQSRKQQLIDLMRRAGELPVYYAGDEDVYFRAANLDAAANVGDGTLFCAVFNLGMDPIDEIVLGCEKLPASVEMLDCDGTRKAVPFTVDAETGMVTVHTPANTLVPVILFLS